MLQKTELFCIHHVQAQTTRWFTRIVKIYILVLFVTMTVAPVNLCSISVNIYLFVCVSYFSIVWYARRETLLLKIIDTKHRLFLLYLSNWSRIAIVYLVLKLENSRSIT